MIVEITRYRVRCDLCGSLDGNLRGDDTTPKGARTSNRFFGSWRHIGGRDICGTCLAKRACRIFGHDAGRSTDSGLVSPGGSAWCRRCREYWPWP